MSSIPTILHHSNNWNARELGMYNIQLHRNNAQNILMTDQTRGLVVSVSYY
jgi:hypothetical protein